MATPKAPGSLTLRTVARGAAEDGVEPVSLETDRGAIDCRWHVPEAGDAAVVWVGGAGGGLWGPARGMYARLGARLAPRGVGSLRLDYRRPNDLAECVLDTLLGVAYVRRLGRARVVLVGHSFGGAVVIAAGALSDDVRGVAALSSQTYGTGPAALLAPRALLLLHGIADEVLPADCSRDIYARAHEPKRLELYPGCRHGLDECMDEVDRDLVGWIEGVVGEG